MRITKGRSKRLLGSAIAVTAGAALALGGTASLAQASGPQVIDGKGAAYNDWGDEGDLSRHSHANSNATRLWQTVLYADGAKWKDSYGNRHTFKQWDIDGSFGRKTESATKWWQQHEDVEDIDGIVGKETFGVADDYLDGPGYNGRVTYTGYQHDVTFKRLGGTYYVKIDGQWKKAAYNWR
ncbi:peptidoglycan-binding domain-containing protein [Streptomyces sp. MZ04]|uniref:peptidoglycan-binding domain-containing protein n=1 Tax=Streptomyces sp. MZ04 TaxID=2559236 RepID=UPI001FD76966|nr:peptidoglycan-binding domain-containing protein [Streptomyces sp. MZ04]